MTQGWTTNVLADGIIDAEYTNLIDTPKYVAQSQLFNILVVPPGGVWTE